MYNGRFDGIRQRPKLQNHVYWAVEYDFQSEQKPVRRHLFLIESFNQLQNFFEKFNHLNVLKIVQTHTHTHAERKKDIGFFNYSETNIYLVFTNFHFIENWFGRQNGSNRRKTEN